LLTLVVVTPKKNEKLAAKHGFHRGGIELEAPGELAYVIAIEKRFYQFSDEHIGLGDELVGHSKNIGLDAT
jgi:hypothetical protein